MHPLSDEYTEMIAFEHEDGIEYTRTDVTKAIEWLYQRQAVDLEVSDIEKFMNAFKKDMET